MTVLVAGATGHLGALLVARLAAEGYQVRILTRRPFLAARQFGEAADIHEWHPGAEAVPAPALDGVLAVIHLTGAPLAVGAGRGQAEVLERIRLSRTGSIARLVAGFGHRPIRFIVASVTPTSETAGAVLTEASTDAVQPSPFRSAVLAWEAAAHTARAGGASIAIVRLGLLLAPGPALQALVQLAALGIQPNLSGRIIPVIAPQDAAAMLSGLVGRPDIEGPIHGVAPEPLTGDDLGRMLAAAQRLPFRLWAPPAAVMLRIGPLAPLLLNRARIVPQRLADMGAGFEHPDPKAVAAQVIGRLIEEASVKPPPWLKKAAPA